MKQIGRYEIQRELGRGAMGVVYAATDPLIGRQVAIKTIRLGALEMEANRAEMTERLRREARAAGVLSHPGIITIHDQGEQGEDAFIVMEFIDGSTVEEMLASGIPQHSANLFSILKKSADALDYAHGKGIIHRDIKPSNIMVCPDGTVKIADFGIAKLNASTSLTQSGFVLGTPNYMSPEQAQGRAVDGHSDQFSLAVVAYRLLTGRLPFEGPTLTALLAKILWEEPEYEAAGLNPPIRNVLERALKKDPQSRYLTCTEFVRELENAHTGIAAEAQSNLGADNPVPTSVGLDSKRARSRKTVLVGWIAATGIVVLAAIAFLVSSTLRKPSPAPENVSRSTSYEAATSGTPPVPEPSVQVPKPEPSPSVPASTKPALGKSTAPAVSVPASKQKDQNESISPADPTSGVLVWSGRLEKNSILILGDKATIGALEGKLPGKPIQIEVQPADVIIRQRPGEANGWNQIILYSGNQKYDLIKIHWKLVR